ncbi:MAG: DUF6156 family protein [Candidatus Methylumidiphilus sp.]
MTDTLPDDCRHYLSYTGVKLPLALVEELQPAQLENRITFFNGYYDGDGRLVAVRKMVYGEIEMEHRYEYSGEGVLQKAEITDMDGEVTVLLFDGQGNPIRQGNRMKEPLDFA